MPIPYTTPGSSPLKPGWQRIFCLLFAALAALGISGFAHGAAPTVQTNAATNRTATSATLNATVTNNGGSSIIDARFEYTSSAFPGTVIYSVPVSGSSFSYNVTGLQPNTTYTYHAYAKNAAGLWNTSVNNVSFTTNSNGNAPTVQTNAATNRTATSATLNATVTNNGGSSIIDARFEYTSSSFPGTVIYNVPVSGSSFSSNITGLQPNTTYTYHAYAKNAAGLWNTSVNNVSFTTNSNGNAPTVQTNAATNRTATSATLNATVTNNGGSSIIDARFEYTSSGFPGTVIYNVPVSGSSFSSNITGLQPNTTYTYHAYAKNSAGLWNTTVNNVSFTTDSNGNAPTVQTNAATNRTATSATLNATVTNNGGSSIIDARFEYTSSGFPGTVIYSVPVSGTSFSWNVTGLQPNTTYTYHAYAKNSTGLWNTTVNNVTFTTDAGNQVNQPDLVPSNVVVSPSSFIVGDTVTISLKLINQGSGDAVPSKTRLRINSSAATTSAADLSLGDIDTPVVPKNSSITLSRQVQIAGITAGTYYVWVSVDNTNLTNQTDGTNDYAHSPLLSIGMSTRDVPIIENLSTDQVLPDSSPVTLSVRASGPGTLRHQWKQGGRSLAGETGTSIRVNAADNYTVDITNAAGTTSSGVIRVTANSTPAVILQPPLVPGMLQKTYWVNSSAPSIVITHGWQQSSEDWTRPPANIKALADAIHARVPSANILLFLWPKAYTLPGYPAGAYVGTPTAGAFLASSLITTLGYGYDKPIQLIGHSFGSFVNAIAVSKLPWHISQFTILDAPTNLETRALMYFGGGAISLSFYLGPPSPQIFYKNLDVDQVDWVDNYIAGLPSLGAHFGSFITGSSPGNGQIVGYVNHSTIVSDFYSPTVSGVTASGFNHSVFVNNGASDLPRWRRGSAVGKAFDDISSIGLPILGSVKGAIDVVNSTVRNIFQLFTQSGQSVARTSDVNGLNDSTDQASSTNSAVAFYLGIPPDAETLNFDFKFAQPGNGDWLEVSFNGNTIFNFLGNAFVGTEYDEAQIPVSNIAGQAGVFTITLHSASALQAELRIANVHFAGGSEELLTPFVPVPNGAVIGLVANANGKYVTAEAAGSSPLIANRSMLASWEQFQILDLGNGYVALRSLINGLYVCAENAGSAPLIANRSAIGIWEQFQLVDAGSGSFALLARANGRYVCAESGGSASLIANRTAIGSWEQFRMVFMPSVKPVNVTSSLQSVASGAYVCAENGGGAPLVVNRPGQGAWEQFQLIDVGNGNVAIRSLINGQFVAADNYGAAPLIANRSTPSTWEQFQLLDVGGGTVALRALVNGQYVSAGNAGQQLIANRSFVGQTEQFILNVSLRAVVNNSFVSAPNNGANPLIANRPTIGVPEQFQVVNTSDGYFGLKAKVNGMYVCAENYGKEPLIANRPSIGAWEQFQWIVGGNGNVALRAAINGQFVCAENGGNDPLVANRPSAGNWEQFR